MEKYMVWILRNVDPSTKAININKNKSIEVEKKMQHNLTTHEIISKIKLDEA